MYSINLLPWRVQKQAIQKKQFLAALIITSLLSFSVLLILNYNLKTQLDLIQTKNHHLQKTNKNLNIKNNLVQERAMQYEVLKKQVEEIRAMRAKRSLIIHLLDEMPKQVPTGLYLTAFDREGKMINVQGRASSHAQVSLFMQQLAVLTWLLPPVLKEIKVDQEASGFPYVFQVQLQEQAP